MTARTLSRRYRDRLCPIVTIILAAISVWGARSTADYVKNINSTRILGAVMTGALSQNRANVPALLPALKGLGTQMSPEPAENDGGREPKTLSIKELEQATASVEVIVVVWERAMYAVAALVGLLGALSLATGRIRLMHLLVAGLITLSAAGTLVAMLLLVDPNRGALPALPTRSFIYVAVAQAFYAPVLLLAFARRAPAKQAPLHNETGLTGTTPLT